MATQDRPISDPPLGERVIEDVESAVRQTAARAGEAVLMGAEEIAALIDGLQVAVAAALEGQQPREHNVAPAFALGALFGVLLTLAAVGVGALIG